MKSLAIACAATLIAAAVPVHACTCAKRTDVERFCRAKYVFVAEILTNDLPAADHPTRAVEATARVVREYKGHLGSEVKLKVLDRMIKSGEGFAGSSCSWSLQIPGTYLVYADNDGITLAACSGTRPMRAAAEMDENSASIALRQLQTGEAKCP